MIPLWAVAVVVFVFCMFAITAWMVRRSRLYQYQDEAEWSGTMAAAPQRRYPTPAAGRPVKPATRSPARRKLPVIKHIGCDRCGYSAVDGSKHQMITYARHEIKTSTGSIFLCDHHRRAYAPVIIDRGYETCGA